LYLQWNLFLKYIGIKHPIRPVKTIENNRLDSSEYWVLILSS